MRAAKFTLILASLVCANVSAHDFWIALSKFDSAPRELVQVHLLVGENLAGTDVPRDISRIERFVLAGPDGESAVIGRDGATPAGFVRAPVSGIHVVGYFSKPTPLELESAKFETYLWKEGLDAIVTERHKRGDAQKPGREIYSRCAKALLMVDGATNGFDRVLNFPLELIPEVNPFAMKPGDSLSIFLRSENKPLAGALVVAISAAHPDRRIMARSDDAGRVTLQLPESGRWLVKAVHMIPAAHRADADWQSVWASLAFEMPEMSPP